MKTGAHTPRHARSFLRPQPPASPPQVLPTPGFSSPSPRLSLHPSPRAPHVPVQLGRPLLSPLPFPVRRILQRPQGSAGCLCSPLRPHLCSSLVSQGQFLPMGNSGARVRMVSLSPAQTSEEPQETGCYPISTRSPAASWACFPCQGALSCLPGKSLKTLSTQLLQKLPGHPRGTPRAT